MKNNHVVLLLVLLLTTAGRAIAQDSRRLSLEEAIALSQKASGQLRVAEARRQMADATHMEAKDARLPDVTVSGSYLRLAQPTIDLKIRTGSSATPPEGGSGSSPEVSQAAYGMANVSLPLFAGNRVNSAIRSTGFLAEAARLDEGQAQMDVQGTTVAAYSNLYKAAAAVRLVRESLEQSRQRVKELSNLEKNGLLARNDLLKAELQQSNVELALLDAENSRKIAMEQLALLLGLPRSTALETDTAFVRMADDRSAESWQETALASRKDAAALGYRTKAAAEAIRIARADYYPSIALTGGYVAAEIPNVITITNAVNAGIGVRYSPSSLWKTKSKVAAAKARLAETEAQMGMLEDAIRLQTSQAYENFLLSKKKIEVYAVALEQSAENYRIVRNKYTNSLATTTELLDADVARLQAKLNYSFAEADAAVAYRKLLQTAGVNFEEAL